MSVQEYRNSVCDNYISNHPGRTITMHDNPEMVGHTFPKAVIPINIQAQFRVAGLVPVNRDVFEDCYFMPAEKRDCSKPVNNTTPA